MIGYKLPEYYFHIVMEDFELTIKENVYNKIGSGLPIWTLETVKKTIPKNTVFCINQMRMETTYGVPCPDRTKIHIQILKKWNKLQKKSHPNLWAIKTYPKPFSRFYGMVFKEFERLSQSCLPVDGEIVEIANKENNIQIIFDWISDRFGVIVDETMTTEDLSSILRERERDYDLYV